MTALHPQVRLLLAVGAMIVAFGEDRPLWLGLLTAALVAVSVVLDIGPRFWLSLVRRLRWFLLAVLLLHLCFFPGHTFGGVSWLSRDGLQRGLLLCWQILLGFGAAGLLAGTTGAQELADALTRLLAPAGRLFPAARSFLRVLPRAVEMLPEVRRATVALWSGSEDVRRRWRGGRLLERAFAAGEFLEQLVTELADLAERRAWILATGESEYRVDAKLFTRLDWGVLILLALVILSWLLL